MNEVMLAACCGAVGFLLGMVVGCLAGYLIVRVSDRQIKIMIASQPPYPYEDPDDEHDQWPARN